MQLMRAYIAQQTPAIKTVIAGWKDSGYSDIKFALIFALDDMCGVQHDGSDGSFCH